MSEIFESVREILTEALGADEDEITLEASTGTMSFDDLGEVGKDVQIQVVRDGVWRRPSVISDPELLAPPSK